LEYFYNQVMLGYDPVYMPVNLKGETRV